MASNFSKLTSKEQAFITCVPYRVGAWVSDCDDNASTRLDDRKEQQAIEKAIKNLASEHRKMPFAAKVMKSILANRTQWSVWDNQVTEGDVLGDLEKSLILCTQKGSKRDVAEYKHAIWQIALVVAQAYGEHKDPDNEMHVDRLFAWMASFVKAPKLAKAPENMSIGEKTALKKLRAVLKN